MFLSDSHFICCDILRHLYCYISWWLKDGCQNVFELLSQQLAWVFLPKWHYYHHDCTHLSITFSNTSATDYCYNYCFIGCCRDLTSETLWQIVLICFFLREWFSVLCFDAFMQEDPVNDYFPRMGYFVHLQPLRFPLHSGWLYSCLRCATNASVGLRLVSTLP